MIIANCETIKNEVITIYRSADDYNKYYIIKSGELLARDMTREAAARLFNCYVDDFFSIPLF